VKDPVRQDAKGCLGDLRDTGNKSLKNLRRIVSLSSWLLSSLPSFGCLFGNLTPPPASNVTATSNPLVAQYSLKFTHAGVTARVESGTDTTYGRQTSVLMASATNRPGQELNIIVPGMKPQTTCHMRAHADWAGGSGVDQDHTFTTGAPRTTQKSTGTALLQVASSSISTQTPGLTPAPGVEFPSRVAQGKLLQFYPVPSSPFKLMPNRGFVFQRRSDLQEAQWSGPAGKDDSPSQSSSPSSTTKVQNSKAVGFERSVYYKNKVEFSLDGGWLPINIPFVFDVFLGDGYNTTSLKYTLVPFIGSLRWQIDNVGGPWIFRGNWDLQCSGAVTWIPRGPETRYFAWILGVRRNFVPRRGKIAPYFDGRLGLGNIDAKEPLGVLYAQGQDFTFTVNMGSGVRYNFNPRYSISAGLNWMHISNLYLSQPQFANYGINVYGPMFGFNVRLGKPRYQGSE
jgi:hypothetical protein